MPITVLLRYRKGNSYGLHALLGALESELAHREGKDGFQLRFANSVEEAVQATIESSDEGRLTLVCWSFYSTDFLASVNDMRTVRAGSPNDTVLHLAGGVHATAEPEATLNSGFDAVAVGEGEVTFVAAVEALLDGKDLSEVPGLLLKREGKMIRTGPPRREGLDRYPPFSSRWRRFSPIEITRGCIYACRFCQTPFMFKARFRHRSVPNVREHVAKMKTAGLVDIRFITPTSLSYGTQSEEPNLDAVEELLAGVRAELGDAGRIFYGSFPSEVRPEHVTPEALKLLRRYVSNDNLIIGAQSGSQHMLDESHRGHDVDSILRAVEVCDQAGFKANVDFIFGMPGETREDAAASIKLAEKLSAAGARIHGHTFMPLPGTPWRRAAPGKIDPVSLRALRRLESHGKLYGQWEGQQDIAAELAPLSTSKKAQSRS